MVLLTVVASVVALAGPWPWKFIVDNVLGTEPLPPWLAPFSICKRARSRC